MFDQIINGIVPILITAIIGILTVVIKDLGDAAVAFIEEKKKEAIVKLGAATYNQNLAFAKSAWNIVDEYFRVNSTIEKTIDSAQAKFTEEIKKLIPSITDEEIASLRQAVAGEVNKGRDVVVKPAVVESLKQAQNDIVKEVFDKMDTQGFRSSTFANPVSVESGEEVK